MILINSQFNSTHLNLVKSDNDIFTNHCASRSDLLHFIDLRGVINSSEKKFFDLTKVTLAFDDREFSAAHKVI